MKGKEEDDSRTKSASESLQINHLVGLSARVKLEQMPDRARFQSNLVREGGIFWSLLSYNFNYFVFVLSELIHWWFCYLYVQFLMTLMITK